MRSKIFNRVTKLVQGSLNMTWLHYLQEIGLAIAGHRFPWLGTNALWPWASYLHLCACHQAQALIGGGGNLIGWESDHGPGGK